MACKRVRCVQIEGDEEVCYGSRGAESFVRLCPPRNTSPTIGCQVGANIGGTAFAKLVRAISLRHSAAAAEASHLGVDGGVLVAGLIDPFGTIGGRGRWCCGRRCPVGARRRAV